MVSMEAILGKRASDDMFKPQNCLMLYLGVEKASDLFDIVVTIHPINGVGKDEFEFTMFVG